MLATIGNDVQAWTREGLLAVRKGAQEGKKMEAGISKLPYEERLNCL